MVGIRPHRYTACCWALAVACFATHAKAQPISAVPFYDPGHVSKGLAISWHQPLASALETSAKALAPALQSLCEATSAQARGRLQAARLAWTQAEADWGRYASVPLGPLIARRSLRQIDFSPSRPELIRRAINQAPTSERDMESIGTPAKGFPALEWLLWSEPAAPGTPACHYAVQIAADIGREAVALQVANEAAVDASLDESDASAAFVELINQWVGSIERLRWQQIDRPRKEAKSKNQKPLWPHGTSGQTAAAWGAQWWGLRRLAVMDGGESVPQPGEGLVTLDTYLRGRGYLALADRWTQQITRTNTAMHALQPGQNARLETAVRELARTKQLAENEVATALEVSLGFSDADGD